MADPVPEWLPALEAAENLAVQAAVQPEPDTPAADTAAGLAELADEADAAAVSTIVSTDP